MKPRNISITKKVFFTFILFTMVLLAVLWFFLIVGLDDCYKYVKKAESERVINTLQKMLENDEVDSETVDAIAASNNIAIYITDANGESLYNAEYIVNSRMSSLPDNLFKAFYKKAKENGGETVIEYKGSEMITRKGQEGEPVPLPDGEYGTFQIDVFPEKEENGQTDDSQEEDTQKEDTQTEDSQSEEEQSKTDDSDDSESEESQESEDKKLDDSQIELELPRDRKPHSDEEFRQNFGNDRAESIIYVRIVDSGESKYVIMVNTVLTPLDATVSTIKTELIVISFILIIFGMAAAYLMSRTISKSIIKTTAEAKKLANGDYSVQFDNHDYREISQLSDTLNYAAKELGKIDSLQKELIANVSHDLRTPLTMIKGYSEVMRDIPGENTPENVQNIIDETERLAGLVNDMLDISKLKAGTIEIEPDFYNITNSIRYVLNRYNKLREVEGYIIDFQYEDEVNIYADEQKMYQVIYNLINNAINYTGEDKRVTVVQKVFDNTLRLEVTDTGNGVSKEDIPYVWDRYYKDKTNHVRAKAGTGLGLSIVKSILELHGASYGVSSTVGAGATFWFEMEINPYLDEEEK